MFQHDLGCKVYFLKSNKVVQGTIHARRYVDHQACYGSYDRDHDAKMNFGEDAKQYSTEHGTVDANLCYTTKEELLASL